MRILFTRPAFQRRPLQRLLLGIGVVAVVAIAAVGAVLGLALLTVGALAHFGFRALRGAVSPGNAVPRDRTVIDGEFRVVHRVRPHQLPRAG